MTPFLQPGVWYDFDQAACALVQALGLYHNDGTTFGPAKWVFASNNPVGNAITEFLCQLADAGLLERGESADVKDFRLPLGYDPKRFSELCPQTRPEKPE